MKYKDLLKAQKNNNAKNTVIIDTGADQTNKSMNILMSNKSKFYKEKAESQKVSNTQAAERWSLKRGMMITQSNLAAIKARTEAKEGHPDISDEVLNSLFPFRTNELQFINH